jgi:hypothetical protein
MMEIRLPRDKQWFLADIAVERINNKNIYIYNIHKNNFSGSALFMM